MRDRAGFAHPIDVPGYGRQAMSRSARPIIGLLAALAALALPASALADSGSITNVQRIDDGTAQATFTATSDYCGANGYCGFFAYARAVPAEQPCAVGSGRAIWVSDDVSTTSGTQTGTERFTLADNAPLRLCLFLFQAGDREYPVAETVFDPAAGTAPASTVPAASVALVRAPAPGSGAAAARLRTLSLKTARSEAAKALRAKYGRAYRSGRSRRTTCRRASRTQFRCAVSWRYRTRRYRGTVTLTSTATSKVTRRIAVRRRR